MSAPAPPPSCFACTDGAEPEFPLGRYRVPSGVAPSGVVTLCAWCATEGFEASVHVSPGSIAPVPPDQDPEGGLGPAAPAPPAEWRVYRVPFAFTHHGIAYVYAPGPAAAEARLRAAEGTKDMDKLESFDTRPGVYVEPGAAEEDDETEPADAYLACPGGPA